MLGISGTDFLILAWSLVLSIIALAMMGIDKVNAKLRRGRISENTFGVISLLGGFSGVILGGLIFHHKTSKPRFWIPVFVALFLWAFLLLAMLNFLRV